MSAKGIWIIEDGARRRPKSKKEVREVCATDPHRVQFEETSAFATGYVPEDAADIGALGSVTFVGPDPYAKRNFFGTISNVGFDGAPNLVVK